MSIAVSAIVQPSRVLFVMVAAMAGMIAIIALSVGLGFVGELSLVVRASMAGLLLILAVFGFYHGTRHRKTIHIDISGAGQVRLTKMNESGPCTSMNWPHVGDSAQVVQILRDSTIWPHLLLLRLRADSGIVTTLPILPDSVSRDSFRALSVACRWIAAHNNPPSNEDCQNFSK
ncbi:MAG TPA: protein YgfX [Noviherbaspirillum sp.]|nr:protein YgfX [Noviherbaspirillum sp.]